MLKILRLICFVTLCFATTLAQSQNHAEWNNGVTERWWVDLDVFPRQDLDTAVNRWRSIDADNENANSHKWAGSYFMGSDTHGTYMRWSQRTGFVMAHVDKCAATLTGLSYGRVIASPTSLEFVFEYQKISSSHGHTKSHNLTPTAIKFVPIKWSHDQYLVRKDEMAEFGNYVAGLGKYNQEFAWVEGAEFFVRNISRIKSNYDELPQAPLGYERFIRKPIDAEIRAVGEPKLKRVRGYDGAWGYESHSRVSINVGKLNGVRRGMFFRVLSSDEGESVRIVRVGKHSSEGVIIRWVDESKQELERYSKIQRGWRVSTSPHKYVSSVGS